MWDKAPTSLPVIHPHHPWAPIHRISLMRVEMSAMIHSERRRETGNRTKGFYAACLVFPPHLHSSRFVTWLVGPLTFSYVKKNTICLGIIFSKAQSAYIVFVWWSGVLPWNMTDWAGYWNSVKLFRKTGKHVPKPVCKIRRCILHVLWYRHATLTCFKE